MINAKTTLLTALVCSFFFLQGCATQGSRVASSDSAKRLHEVLKNHRVDANRPIQCHGRQKAAIDCRSLARALESLTLEFPRAPDILVTTAFVQYQLGRTLDSQFTLDQALSLAQPMPEAGVLRSRIALNDGNFTLARDIVARQLRLVPDYAPLYESEAAGYFLQGRYEKALASLHQAEMLGTPSWRIEFHRGLVHQAMGHPLVACSHYSKVLNEYPKHRATKARLRLLGSQHSCYQNTPTQ